MEVNGTSKYIKSFIQIQKEHTKQWSKMKNDKYLLHIHYFSLNNTTS